MSTTYTMSIIPASSSKQMSNNRSAHRLPCVPHNRLLSWAVCLIFTCISLSAKAQETKQYPTFLEKSDVPDALLLLPAPPDTAQMAFLADIDAYEKGRHMRQTERGQRAVDDANLDIQRIVNVLLGNNDMPLTEEKQPRLFHVVERTMNDAYQTISKVKKHYKRTRPYVQFKQPSGIAEEEESHRTTYSYPSAHSAMTWAAALVLAEMFPQRQDIILRQGYEQGESRVIVGYHYKSDVEAARLAASATVARLHADKRFAKAMKRAKKEARKWMKH